MNEARVLGLLGAALFAASATRFRGRSLPGGRFEADVLTIAIVVRYFRVHRWFSEAGIEANVVTTAIVVALAALVVAGTMRSM